MTGKALGTVFQKLKETNPALELRAFVSASGSAGTLGAGDRLKDDFGSQIVAVEAFGMSHDVVQRVWGAQYSRNRG